MVSTTFGFVNISASTGGSTLNWKYFYFLPKEVEKRRKSRRGKGNRHKTSMKNPPGALVQVGAKYLSFNGKRYYRLTAIDTFSRLPCDCVSKRKHRFQTGSFRRCSSTKIHFRYLPYSPRSAASSRGPFEEKCKGMGIAHLFSYPKSPKQKSQGGALHRYHPAGVVEPRDRFFGR